MEAAPSASTRVRRGAGRRRRTRGQNMVEFALCAPIVFAILFGVINGGLLMYARNTVTRASNVGAVNLAAEGVALSTDQDTLAVMRKSGIGSNALVGVKWVEIAEVAYSQSTDSYQVVNLCTTRSGTGNQPCINTYNMDGSVRWDVGGCTDTTYYCPPWPAGSRNVTASSASIVRLTIHYTFSFFTTGTTFTFDEVNIFRLEPKQVG